MREEKEEGERERRERRGRKTKSAGPTSHTRLNKHHKTFRDERARAAAIAGNMDDQGTTWKGTKKGKQVIPNHRQPSEKDPSTGMN